MRTSTRQSKTINKIATAITSMASCLDKPRHAGLANHRVPPLPHPSHIPLPPDSLLTHLARPASDRCVSTAAREFYNLLSVLIKKETEKKRVKKNNKLGTTTARLQMLLKSPGNMCNKFSNSSPSPSPSSSSNMDSGLGCLRIRVQEQHQQQRQQHQQQQQQQQQSRQM